MSATSIPKAVLLSIVTIAIACSSDDRTSEAGEGEGEGEGAAEGEGEGEGEGAAEGEGEGPAEGEGEGPAEGEGEGPGPAVCGEAPVLDFLAGAVDGPDGNAMLRGDSGRLNDHEGSCGGTNGDEAVAWFVAPSAGAWLFTTEHDAAEFDTILYARTDCLDEATELACNDDIDTDGEIYTSQVRVTLEAGQAVFLFIDAFSATQKGAFFLTAKKVTLLDTGAECTPDDATTSCADGAFCLVPPGDGEPAATGTCVESTPPAIVGGSAHFTRRRLSVRVEGRDTSRDVVAMGFELLEGGDVVPLDPETGEGSLSAGLAEPVVGQEEFTARLGIPEAAFYDALGFSPFEDFPDIDGVRVRLLDSRGLESEPLDLDFEPATEIAVDGDCDPLMIDNACEVGAACITEGEDAPTGTCLTQTAPVLTAAVGYYNPVTGAMGLLLDGTDPDEDVSYLGLALLDADGVVILPGPDEGADAGGGANAAPAAAAAAAEGEGEGEGEEGEGEGEGEEGEGEGEGEGEEGEGEGEGEEGEGEGEGEEGEGEGEGEEGEGEGEGEGELSFYELDFDTIEQEDGVFHAELATILPAELGVPATAFVVVFDGQDLRSEPVELTFLAPPAVAHGAVCDVVTAMSVCPEGELCYFEDPEADEEPTCIEAETECPAGWDVVDLGEHEDEGRYQYNGDTTGLEYGEGGTCGGGSGAEVLSFTAPEAGSWLFETWSRAQEADTVLYVRSFCGYPAPGAQLGCNDDIDYPNDTMSQVIVALEADQTVYVFVDGYGGWQGAYRLYVELAD